MRLTEFMSAAVGGIDNVPQGNVYWDRVRRNGTRLGMAGTRVSLNTGCPLDANWQIFLHQMYSSSSWTVIQELLLRENKEYQSSRCSTGWKYIR
ncbi:hypothetical protein ABIB48_001177 [Arthrobacter sp. UYCu511]